MALPLYFKLRISPCPQVLSCRPPARRQEGGDRGQGVASLLTLTVIRSTSRANLHRTKALATEPSSWAVRATPPKCCRPSAVIFNCSTCGSQPGAKHSSTLTRSPPLGLTMVNCSGAAWAASSFCSISSDSARARRSRSMLSTGEARPKCVVDSSITRSMKPGES